MIKILALIASALLLWSLVALARVENQRYAMAIGMCRMPPPVEAADLNCLERVQTRTNPLWHVYYGLTGR